MNAREYLCEKYSVGMNENFSVNYYPFSSSRLVETVNVDRAVKLIAKDIEDFRQFLKNVGIDEANASECAFRLWDKKIVVFR